MSQPEPTTGHGNAVASVAETAQQAWSVADVQRTAAAIIGCVESVISGKRDVIATAVICLLSDGHLLIEDVPGVGKTKLAQSLAAAISGDVQRIQFTPDLLPSDLTGVSVYHQRSGKFEFSPGPLFGNIVIGDEINRASPKTQSALLEAMSERRVTVDGQTRELPRPFTVVATQNPIEMEGTFPLPEAQRDRFMAQVEMGYPDRTAEVEMLDLHAGDDPLERMRPVCDVADVRAMISTVITTHVSAAIREYVVQLATFTREHEHVRLGASPRAALQLVRAAKVAATLDGRGYVTPDDVRQLAPVVWSHRLLVDSSDYRSRHVAGEVIDTALRTIPLRRD